RFESKIRGFSLDLFDVRSSEPGEEDVEGRKAHTGLRIFPLLKTAPEQTKHSLCAVRALSHRERVFSHLAAGQGHDVGTGHSWSMVSYLISTIINLYIVSIDVELHVLVTEHSRWFGVSIVTSHIISQHQNNIDVYENTNNAVTLVQRIQNPKPSAGVSTFHATEMNTNEAKEYLSRREIPQLFESLLTGLMYYRPDDPIEYLETCLKKVRDLGGSEKVRWDTFVGQEKKSLPPLNGGQSRRSFFRNDSRSSPAPQFTISDPLLCDTYPMKLSTIIHHHWNTSIATILPDSPNFPYRRYERLPPINQFSIESDSDLSETAELIEEYEVFDPSRPRPKVVLIIAWTLSPPSPEKGAEDERQRLLMGPMEETQRSEKARSIKHLQRKWDAFEIGGPGSGKGTQCLKIAERYSFEYVSVGELLRKKMIHNATSNRKWSLIARIITNGELAPQETTITEIKQKIMKIPEASGIVIDGFPRDVGQALSFEDQVCTPDLVVFLACSNQRLKERLEKRAEQQGRPDDNPKAIDRRLTNFKQNAIPLVKYFQEKGLIV
ncbi:hypothetical protein DNTS_022300, partial [Danionella cerebrum]